MRKAKPCRDPRVTITKVKRSYKTSSGLRYAEEIGLFSSDKEDLVCPRCLSENIRKYGKSDPITRWDLLQKGKGVGRVTLQAQLWACRNCKNWKFTDPRFPYIGKGTTTPEFDHWVSRQLIESPETFQTEFASKFDLPVSTINRIVREKLNQAEGYVMCTVPVTKLWIIPFHYQKSDCLMAIGSGIADLDFCTRMELAPDSYVLLGISKGRSFQDLKDASRIVITETLEQIYCPENLITPSITSLCSVTPYDAAQEPDIITLLTTEIKKLHNKRVAYDKLLLFLLHNDKARLEEVHFEEYGYFAKDCYTGYVCSCLTGKQTNYSVSDLARWADQGVRYFCVDAAKLLNSIHTRAGETSPKAKVR